jgi:hypothetical protein
LVQETNPIWHLDSTGNVIENVNGQSPPFLYSLVFQDTKNNRVLPVAELITTAHDSHSISGYLSIIKMELQRTIPKKRGFQHAPIIITDFSWSLINAVLNVFKNCDISAYLNWCYEILFEFEKSYLIVYFIKVRMHLCSTHFLKMVIKQVRKIKINEIEEVDKKIQNIFIFVFTLLQESSTVKEFSLYIKHAFNIFCLKKKTEKNIASLEEVKKKLRERKFTTFSIEDEDKTSTQKYASKKILKLKYMLQSNLKEENLKFNSPFRKYYEKLIKNHETNLKTKSSEKVNQPINEYFCPKFFAIVQNYIHLLPLWSSIMISNWEELNPKYKGLKRLTNNPVENWFNQVKSLISRRKVMPSVLTSILLKRIDAVYYEIYEKENIMLKRQKGGIFSKKETWKSKASSNKRKGYYYNDSAEKLFDYFEKKRK